MWTDVYLSSLSSLWGESNIALEDCGLSVLCLSWFLLKSTNQAWIFQNGAESELDVMSCCGSKDCFQGTGNLQKENKAFLVCLLLHHMKVVRWIFSHGLESVTRVFCCKMEAIVTWVILEGPDCPSAETATKRPMCTCPLGEMCCTHKNASERTNGAASRVSPTSGNQGTLYIRGRAAVGLLLVRAALWRPHNREEPPGGTHVIVVPVYAEHSWTGS